MPNIYEFIVLQQTDASASLPVLMANYDHEARPVSGFIASGHFHSFYALPKPDTSPVYIMIYQWENPSVIPIARDHLVSSSALQALFAAADITAFALTEQIEGQSVDVQSIAMQPGQVLEVAIRRIKSGLETPFEEQRKAFIAKLDSSPVVLANAEFRATLGNNPERLTVGISVYRDQAAFQQIATELMSDPATAAYFATFDPEAVKYATKLYAQAES